jgi:hypothetical protein
LAWFNADDKMHSHPKPRQAGLEAMGLWLMAGTYCSDYLTEGLVPGWYVDSWPRGRRLAQQLVTARFWETAGTDWQFLSWTEYQRSKEQVEEDRAKARARQKAWRDKRRDKPDG